MEKHNLIIGKDQNNEGYTLFRNLDTVMVEAIKALEYDRGVFNTHQYQNAKIERQLSDTQTLCIDQNGRYFILNNNEFDSIFRDDRIKLINQNFRVDEAIAKSLGTLITEDGQLEVKIQHINVGGGMRPFDAVSSGEYGLYVRTGGIHSHDIYATESNGDSSRGMFCKLNEDGNITNRDYNLDIAKYIGNKALTIQEKIKMIIDAIPDVEYRVYAHKWFSDKFCFVLRTDFDTHYCGKPIFKLDYYKKISPNHYSGDFSSTIKEPKSTKPSSKSAILNCILPLVATSRYCEGVDLSMYLNSSTPQVIESPKIRVQETIINEDDYDVWDFIGDDEYNDIFENDGFKSINDALLNIKNSINIPENDEIVKLWLTEVLKHSDGIPSFSFDKGKRQKNHDKYIGLVKLPHDCLYTFKVEEGDVCEVTWAHSIYETDIIDLELVI